IEAQQPIHSGAGRQRMTKHGKSLPLAIGGNRRSSIQRQAQIGLSLGSGDAGWDHDQIIAGIEGHTHKITAVPSGIFPVYSMAKCLGRSSNALRYTSSRSLLCQRTVPPKTSRFFLVLGSFRSTHSESKAVLISSWVMYSLIPISCRSVRDSNGHQANLSSGSS